MPDIEDIRFNVSVFFEKTPDFVCIAGKDGFLKKVNAAVIDKLGYTEEELYSKHISTFVHPEDQNITNKERNALHNGKVLLNFENRYITKTGGVIWLEWTSIYFAEDELVFAIAKDVTQRKNIEKNITETYQKFKSLATHFKASIEEDRKYLAFELHEELAQLASVVKMDVDWIRIKAPDLPENVRARVEHASVVADILMNTIKRISFSISPGMLEESGLNATLQWHCKEFSLLNGIPCDFEDNYREDSLSPEMQIDFFRICQEALSNVMYHARATHVKIGIGQTTEQVCLTIEDNGKGFNHEDQAYTNGLLSMRERAASINGKLVIETAPEKGTKISVTVARNN